VSVVFRDWHVDLAAVASVREIPEFVWDGVQRAGRTLVTVTVWRPYRAINPTHDVLSPFYTSG
jgi:hypothetical protein